MNKSKKIILIISLVVSLLIVGTALIVARSEDQAGTGRQSSAEGGNTGAGAQAESRVISREELLKADGKNGNVCFVAVDGTVYEIKDFSMWRNGQHEPSGGQAYCGADMSEIIDKAPHGRKMLDLLIKVGPLKN